MQISLHKNATTTPTLPKTIQESTLSERKIAQKDKKPSGNHLFDQVCSENNIDHRLIKPYHPQTNGMVERFNGRISEMLKQTNFTSSSELKQARYLRLYNHHIPQSSLGYLTPVEALKKWQKSHPHLFKKSIYNEAKPDKTYRLFRGRRVLPNLNLLRWQ